jgi:3-dehydroquinate dehydratase II
MAKIQVLNGPNVNLIGTHRQDLFGSTTLEQLDQHLIQLARLSGHELETFQSNAEHELINKVQTSRRRGIAFIILNPGGLAYTSVALWDALSAVEVPFVEVHLSNIYARDAFRSRSYFSGIAAGTISGLGAYGYELALLHIFRGPRRQHAAPLNRFDRGCSISTLPRWPHS